MRNEPLTGTPGNYKISKNFLSSKKFYPFKDFQSDQVQRTCRKIFTAHYACRNADLNLTLVTGAANRFIFHIISSLRSCGVCFTCLDCRKVKKKIKS